MGNHAGGIFGTLRTIEQGFNGYYGRFVHALSVGVRPHMRSAESRCGASLVGLQSLSAKSKNDGSPLQVKSRVWIAGTGRISDAGRRG
jgi:hypothetical protein